MSTNGSIIIPLDAPLVNGGKGRGINTAALERLVADAAAAGLGIHFDVDCIGGDVAGVYELAEAVYAARELVPVTAYVRGHCASAAYWVASQCSHIECSPVAIIGQVGAQITTISAGTPTGGVTPFVATSAGAERKNAGERDPDQYQALVDAAGEQFVAHVARGRGVSVEVVRSSYGHGALLPAVEALRIGMIDAVRGAAGGAEMAKYKAEEMSAPPGEMAPELAPEDKDAMIEELKRQLAEKDARLAELEAACKPSVEAEAGTDVPDSPVDPELDPEKEALKAELVKARMTAEVSTLVANGILPPGRRAEVEKAYRLEVTAKADARLAEFATAYTDLVAQLKKSAPVYARASVANPGQAEKPDRNTVMAARAKELTSAGMDPLDALRAAEKEIVG